MRIDIYKKNNILYTTYYNIFAYFLLKYKYSINFKRQSSKLIKF